MLTGTLLDGEGREILPAETNADSGDGSLTAYWGGTTCYGAYDGLRGDTDYYIRLRGADGTDYSLAAFPEGAEPPDAVPRLRLQAGDSCAITTDQDGAPLIAADTTYEVHFSGGYTWSAFATGGDDRAVYRLALQNNTGDGEALYGRLMDQYGREVFPAETNTADAYGLCAQPDGTPVYGLYRGLRPDTVYFIRIEKNGEASYYLEVTAYVAAEQ